jgi:DNA-binding Xre family transcriptional regulator
MKCNLSTIMGKNRCCIEDVHKGTGLSRSTITELYHDRATRIDYTTIEKLCQYFRITVDELFTIEQKEEEKD